MADVLPSRARPRGRVRRAADPVLVGCFVLLLAFPVLATLAANNQPRPPRAAAAIEVPQGAGASLKPRVLPAFTTEPDLTAALASTPAMQAAVAERLTAAFGPGRGAALLRLAQTADVNLDASNSIDAAQVSYPFRYPRIDRVLAGAQFDPAAANNAAALLILATAREGGWETISGDFQHAAKVAFAILDRARAGGDCLPQLNLAFLLSTDANSRDADVAREAEAAARDCPGDPTPLWLLGEYQSQRVEAYSFNKSTGGMVEVPDPLRRPLATFARLQRRWPRSALGWAGAGDTELRLAYQLDARAPFGAREHFTRALALYRAARSVDDDPNLAAGEARALAGLHRYAEAAAAQASAVTKSDQNAPLLARQVEYLEQARRFDRAADAAGQLEADPALAPLRSLLPKIFNVSSDRLLTEDALGPVSTGSDRMRAVELSVGPPPGGAGSGGADLSFIPLYRNQPALTGYDRWCPGWERRRDLVLAGKAEEALNGLPATFRDVRPWVDRECPLGSEGVPLLRAIALLESGDRSGALAAAKPLKQRGDRAPGAVLEDADQDLWRFAGNDRRAARAAARWMDDVPADADAPDRAGEIAFLAGDYAAAARWFGRAISNTRATYGGWTSREARSLLKRGVALGRLGDDDRALAALAAADEVGTRMEGFGRSNTDLYTQGVEGAWYSYHARAQAGDIALRTRRYRLAAEYYDSAEDRVPTLNTDLAQFDAKEPLVRPEVLHNNRALAEIKVRHPRTALAAARQAVAADAADPLFRETEGFALQRLGRTREAVSAYRIGLAADPTMYPAWNDLGVQLTKQGHPGAAVDALRRAVGAEKDYALGWFNLGVAQEDRGPLDLAAAQGAFGRAFALDERLRDRPHDPIPDDAVYITQLDLSKPLPPEWGFNHTQERAPVVAAGFAVVLLLGLRLARGFSATGGRAGPATQLLETGRAWLDRLPAALRYMPAAVAVVVTIALFVWPLVRTGGAALSSVLLLTSGVALLVTIVMRVRVLAARAANVTLEQRSWGPAVGFGVVTAAFGVPWAPLPVARTSRPAAAVHWLGPVLLAGTALALLLLAAWMKVPMTRTLGGAALVMAASMLVPIEPLDGAAVAKGTGTAVTLAVLGTGTLLLVGLI